MLISTPPRTESTHGSKIAGQGSHQSQVPSVKGKYVDFVLRPVQSFCLKAKTKWTGGFLSCPRSVTDSANFLTIDLLKNFSVLQQACNYDQRQRLESLELGIPHNLAVSVFRSGGDLCCGGWASSSSWVSLFSRPSSGSTPSSGLESECPSSCSTLTPAPSSSSENPTWITSSLSL